MAKISRADWAATTPWDGITDKPASFGVSDIGQLTGDGYADGQIAVYKKSLGRFLPGSRNPSPSPTPPEPTPGPADEITVDWDVPSLHALQTATEDFDFVGALPSQAVAVGASYSNEFVQISATVVDVNVVRISVTNMGIDDLDIDDGFYRLRLFNGV